MAKTMNIIKDGAYVYNVVILPNISFIDELGVTKYMHRISITFDIKGENIIDYQESREYYSDTFNTIQTVNEWSTWQSANILNFIYAGKNDIAGYVPPQ